MLRVGSGPGRSGWVCIALVLLLVIAAVPVGATAGTAGAVQAHDAAKKKKKKQSGAQCRKRSVKRKTPKPKPKVKPRTAGAAKTKAKPKRKPKKRAPCKAGKRKPITPVPVVPAAPASTAPRPPAPELRVSSPDDALGLGSRMVFSTVRNQPRAGRAFIISSVGPLPLNVTGMEIGGAGAADFQLCPGQPTTLSLNPGAATSVCVQYRPPAGAQGTQVSQAQLTLLSNDYRGPYAITLGGLNTHDYEGTNEPSLQQIFDALGYRDNAGVINKPFPDSLGPSSTAVGDEVLSAYWTAADPSRPVTLLPVAHFAGKNAGADSPQFGWYAKGSATTNYLYTFPGGNSTGQANDGYGQNQLLLPGTTTGRLTFTPGGPFGLNDGQGWHSDDGLNAGAEHWHNLRFFPARNAAGETVPGAYLVGEDITSPVQVNYKNWDYQDYVFLLLNAQPESGASGQPAPGEVARTLSSFGGAGGVGGTGFTSVQGALDLNRVAFPGGQLRVLSSNDTNTSHTNALQLGANAGTGFRVDARLVGPFTALDAGAEQQGIYWGPDATNYVKAEVEWNAGANGGAGGRVLTIWMQQGNTGWIVNSIPLPGGDAGTIDLRILVDPVPPSGGPTATVSYALNGSPTFTNINSSPIGIPAAWITANTPAGIVASHQQGGSPFTATFASFAVNRTY
jgi:hypothetical protein